MLTFLVVSAVVGFWGALIKAGIQKAAADKAHTATDEAITDVYEAQRDSVQDAYDAQVKAVKDEAVQVRGTQNQTLAVMGQAGGADTGAAGVINDTTRMETEDLSQLDVNLQNAINDLDAETNMARTRNNNDYNLNLANIATQAIGDITDIALNFGANVLKLPKSDTETLLGGGGGGGGGRGGNVLQME